MTARGFPRRCVQSQKALSRVSIVHNCVRLHQSCNERSFSDNKVTRSELPPDSKPSPFTHWVSLWSSMASTIRINRENHKFFHKRKRMNLSIGTFLLLSSTFGAPVTATRVWSDIETYHTLDIYDGRFGSEMNEVDALLFTPHPSNAPSKKPSKSPSLLPTVTASDFPTRIPSKTSLPSASPSKKPSKRPSSVPSAIPSGEPTEPEFPENDPPPNADSSYFDYNVGLDAEYGPGYPELVPHNATYVKVKYLNNAWTTRTVPKDWYWNEFDVNGTGPWKGLLGHRNPSKNKCEESPDQSPIDIRDSGAECFEHHQIRTLVSFGMSCHDIFHFF